MTLGKGRSVVGLAGLLVLTAACEPANILEARDQLGRGGERSVVFALPLIDTVFKVETLLEDSEIDTTASGLLAVRIDPDSVSAGYGEDLVFEGVDLDTTVVSFTPAELAVGPGEQISFSVVNDGMDTDTKLDNVDTVVVYSGVLSVTTRNRLPVPVTYTVTLDGFFQAGGGSLVGGGTIPAASGNGSYRSHVLDFNLAGVTLVPASVSVTVAGSATAGGTPIPAAAGVDAIVQTGEITTIEIEAVSGSLDPALTPELTVSIEEIDEIPESDIDFGDLEDAIKESTLEHATLALVINSSANALVTLSDFNLGVVKLSVAGDVPRDAFGDPVFEEDGGGNPILLALADPGETTLTLNALSTTDLELDASALLDRLVHLLLDGERAAIVAAGSAAVGDGSQARVTRADSVGVELEMTLGLDFTIPLAGVTISRNTTGDGLEFDAEDADQLVERLDSAGIATDVVNETPFAVEIDIAFVEDSLADDVDVFAQPGAVVLSTIALDAPEVDGQGLVTSPSSSTVSIFLTGNQARQLLGAKWSATVRARLLPGTGGGGRGAIRATDEISLQSQARVVLRSGGEQ